MDVDGDCQRLLDTAKNLNRPSYPRIYPVTCIVEYKIAALEEINNRNRPCSVEDDE